MKLVSLLLCLSLISCAVTKEDMRRPNGAEYHYLAVQFAGAGESHASSGAGQTFDGQKSFQDFLTMVGMSVSAWSYASVQAAKYVFQRYAAGEVTKQQARASMERIQLAEIAAKPTAVPAGESVLQGGSILTAPK